MHVMQTSEDLSFNCIGKIWKKKNIFNHATQLLAIQCKFEHKCYKNCKLHKHRNFYLFMNFDLFF